MVLSLGHVCYHVGSWGSQRLLRYECIEDVVRLWWFPHDAWLWSRIWVVFAINAQVLEIMSSIFDDSYLRWLDLEGYISDCSCSHGTPSPWKPLPRYACKIHISPDTDLRVLRLVKEYASQPTERKYTTTQSAYSTGNDWMFIAIAHHQKTDAKN